MRRAAYPAEFLGTFVLVLGGCGSAILAGDRIGFLGVAFAFGLSLLAMAYALGHLSGCHANPAVSLGAVLGDESMRNLPQVRKGDQVTATYYESIALRLREAEGEQPRIAVSEQVERAPLGEKPAGMVVRNATLTAKVAAIDRARETVTLEGPQGGKITLKVQDPANLERAHVGHLVEATYREAVSISVQTPTK